MWQGLSPRLRGSPRQSRKAAKSRGPIPALAGEPFADGTPRQIDFAIELLRVDDEQGDSLTAIYA